LFTVKEVLLSDLEELPNLKIGDYILHIELEELTPEVKEIARKELRETPEVTKQAIAELRDLLRGKDRFPSGRHTIQLPFHVT
jgi:hypothetical protein